MVKCLKFFNPYPTKQNCICFEIFYHQWSHEYKNLCSPPQTKPNGGIIGTWTGAGQTHP